MGMKSFRWEIDNFSDINKVIRSGPYSSGGCEWSLQLFPNGNGYGVPDHLALFLGAYNPKSLRLGWKRRINLFFVFLTQSGKELDRSNDKACSDLLFCAEVTSRIFPRRLPLTKLQEKGFLENNKLIIQVNVEVTQVVHQGKSTENEIFEFNGVQIFASQAVSGSKIWCNHPYFFKDFDTNKHEKAVYFTLFFCLIETLSKSPQNLSVTELRNAQNQLTELTKAGFKLDFLKPKLEEASLEMKKAVPDGCHVLEERVKNVELTLSDLQGKLDKEKIKYAAASRISSFGFIDSLIKRFFLSCFSV